MRLGSYYRAQTLKYFNIKASGDYVLDVGGYDGYWLSTQKAKNKYVTDVNIIRAHQGINYIQHDALNIPFESNKFYQVFAFDVLEHIEEGKEQKFLDELIRVCKKNGEIILTTPSKAIKLFPSFLTNFIGRRWGHHKCNGYSKEELSKLLSKYPGIIYKILDNNALYFLTFFIPIRFLWCLFPKITKRLVDIISLKDYKNSFGDYGFYIIKIIKNEPS